MSNRDIKAIIILLATQGLINIGSVPDPVRGEPVFEPEKARIFLDLLEVLQEKTRGNLTPEEDAFMAEAIENFRSVMKLRVGDGESE